MPSSGSQEGERWTIRVCDKCGFSMLKRTDSSSALTHALCGEDKREDRDELGFRLVEVVPAPPPNPEQEEGR